MITRWSDVELRDGSTFEDLRKVEDEFTGGWQSFVNGDELGYVSLDFMDWDFKWGPDVRGLLTKDMLTRLNKHIMGRVCLEAQDGEDAMILHFRQEGSVCVQFGHMEWGELIAVKEVNE